MTMLVGSSRGRKNLADHGNRGDEHETRRITAELERALRRMPRLPIGSFQPIRS